MCHFISRQHEYLHYKWNPSLCSIFIALDKTLWKAKASSVHQAQPPEVVFDGNCSPWNKFTAFSAGRAAFQWLQIEFPMVIKGIKAVEVVKRHSLYMRFREVELRIGNADESGNGVVQFTENPLVGYSGQATNDPVCVFNLESKYVYGKYLTLQIIVEEHIEAAELFIIV